MPKPTLAQRNSFKTWLRKYKTKFSNTTIPEFYLDDKIIGLPPVPNTLVKFTSWVLHRATPLKSEHRFTYAFKYRKETD